MQSKAKNVDAYLVGVPAERKAVLEEIRRQCLAVLEGFEESMQYGMPCYSRNGVVEVGFASQKHFIGLYILRTDVMNAYRDMLNIKEVSLGKGCIRYSKPEKIDFKIVKSMLKATVRSKGEVC